MKIPMKAITITYTKTWSLVPESHMFDDDIFIPYRSFRENVFDALNEALTPYDLVHKDSQ